MRKEKKDKDETLRQVANLMGGVGQLAKMIGMCPSGITRRIQGEIKTSRMEWLAISAALSKRIKMLVDRSTELALIYELPDLHSDSAPKGRVKPSSFVKATQGESGT